MKLREIFHSIHIYGRQFNIQSMLKKCRRTHWLWNVIWVPERLKGYGAALAARIVRRFGDDTLRIVEEEPERLAEVKGISEKKAREIACR